MESEGLRIKKMYWKLRRKGMGRRVGFGASVSGRRWVREGAVADWEWDGRIMWRAISLMKMRFWGTWVGV